MLERRPPHVGVGQGIRGVYFVLGLGLIVLLICVLIGFVCALVGARQRKSHPAGVACMDLTSDIQP